MAITYSHSSGPKTVLRQVKHRSAKVRAPRSGGPKKCHGILPMQGPSHSRRARHPPPPSNRRVVQAIRMSPQSSAVVFAANRQ